MNDGPKCEVVELDALVVLKVIKHCQGALPSFVTGQLLGLDISSTLEVTNCFPFPSKEDEAAAKADGDDDDDGAEYQMEMMRCLREVNVDNNTVGWYQSTYFSSFVEDACIETQFNYQQNIKNCVVIIYDPSRTRATGMALRAFRLTDAFMGLYKEGKFSVEQLSSVNLTAGDVFEELPIKVRNSHLGSALLLELQDACGLNANSSDFARLELHTNPFLEKQMQLLIECIDDLQQESQKLQHHERSVARQRAAQQQYTLKKRQDAQGRGLRGDELEEELAPPTGGRDGHLFKAIPEPSRLESLLITNQMQAYCQQISQFTGQSFAKLFLMQSLNAGDAQ